MNSKQQVYAFIDSQNVNVSTQKFGWKVDWRKFRRFLKDKYGVDQAFMFIGYVPEFQDMYEFLHDAGYSVVLKPTFDMSKPREQVAQPQPGEKTEHEEKKPVKGNVDAELVLWAMKELKNYDKAIIISGDGDFFCLVEYLEQQGKLLKVMPPNVHYSSLFRPYERYIDHLGNYRRDLAYRDKKSFKKNR
ncbi:MAG TPA: NYN domain-containing protein [Candidatus Saccharimonadales bacterium]|nr:NYN domain-containing protein [Candidatus Saccharimonadales bacterium]